MIGYLIVAALASAPAGEASPPPSGITREYGECVRQHAEGKIAPRVVRYSDELFAASLRACWKEAASQDDPGAEGVRHTHLYVETLAILNAVRRPDSEPAGVALIVTVPAQGARQVRETLDPLIGGDFTVLYWPWVRCLALTMQAAAPVEPDQQIAGARTRCESAGAVADAEARRLLDESANYGDGEHQTAVVAEFKSTMSQVALVGFLRSNGESLGDALERSDEAIGENGS